MYLSEENRPYDTTSLQLYLKGVWHEIFDFSFIHESVSPLATEYPIGAISNFYENSRRYSQLCVYRRIFIDSMTPAIN
jgi:hypothetical protein